MKRLPPLPGFLCVAAEELMDESLRRLNLAERGLVHCLHLLCWSNGSAPEAPAELANMLGVRASEVAKALTPAVLELFILEDGRVVSGEIELKRIEAAQKARKYSEIGKRGAEARWHGPANALANGEGMAIRKEGMEEKERTEGEPPLSKKPTWLYR